MKFGIKKEKEIKLFKKKYYALLKTKQKQRKMNQKVLDTQNAQVCLFYIKIVACLRTKWMPFKCCIN